MNFSIKRPDFLKALQRVQGTVERTDTMPMLAHVLIEAVEGRLTASASDLEIFTRAECGAEVKEKGAVAVNARKLFEIVKDLPGEEVSVSADKGNDKVEIKAGRSRFRLFGLPAKDFPEAPKIDTKALDRMAAEFLSALIDRTAFAVSTDESKYNINGFYFERGEGLTRMVATNGVVLAKIEKPGNEGERRSVLIPRKGAVEMRKLLGDIDGEVLFGADKKRATLQVGDTTISVRLLEGEFPDFERVIPKNHDRTILASKHEVLDALRRVSIVTSAKPHAVKLNIKPGTLAVSSQDVSIGEASEDVDIEYAGDDIEMACSADYLIAAIEAAPGSQIRISPKDYSSPLLIHADGSTEYTGVVMPMRL